VEGLATNHHPQQFMGKNDGIRMARGKTEVVLIDESRKQVRLHRGEWQ
jgi:hypothetical protein